MKYKTGFSPLKYLLIVLPLTAILLDRDIFSFYSPIGRIVLFDLIAFIFLLIFFLTISKYVGDRLIIIFFALLVIFFLYILINIIVKINFGHNFNIGLGFSVFFKTILFAFLYFSIVQTLIIKKYVQHYINVWIFSSVIVIIIAFGQILAINNVAPFNSLFYWENIRGERVASTFRWQGPLVHYIGLILPLLITKWIADNKKTNRYFFGLLSISAIFSLFISGSRSSVLVLPLSLITAVFVLISFRKVKLRVFFYPLIILVLIAVFLKDKLLELGAVKRILGMEGATGLDEEEPRFRIWRNGIELWESEPIFGIGPAQLMNRIGSTPHNTYIEVLVELGLIGALIVFSILIIVIITSLKSFYNGIKNRNIYLIAISIGVFNSLLYQFTASGLFSRLFWLYIPLLFVLSYINKNENSIKSKNINEMD